MSGIRFTAARLVAEVLLAEAEVEPLRAECSVLEQQQRNAKAKRTQAEGAKAACGATVMPPEGGSVRRRRCRRRRQHHTHQRQRAHAPQRHRVARFSVRAYV